MAVDEALARGLDRDTGILRFYQWTTPTVSFGRNQPADGRYDRKRAAELGIDFVRRPTGGRAVLHDRELTYSVVVPDHAFGGPRGIYSHVQAALARGLSELGVGAVEQEPVSDRVAPRPSTHPCFGEALPGEVTVSGQKVVGSAQARISGAVLQHGSILLRNDQSELGVLTLGDEVESEVTPKSGPVTLQDVGVLVSPDEATPHLRRAFVGSVAGSCIEDSMSDQEHALAEGLLSRFKSAAWTWRR